MKTLVIDEKDAKMLYPNASKEIKLILENTFGKELFSIKLIDTIKDFNDILKISNKELEKIIPYLEPKNKEQKSLNALAKIQLISKVLNEGTILDWCNENQYKYYPYFKKITAGWEVDSCYYYYCSAYVGFGYYYISSELALFAANTFKDIYIDYLPE